MKRKKSTTFSEPVFLVFALDAELAKGALKSIRDLPMAERMVSPARGSIQATRLDIFEQHDPEATAILKYFGPYRLCVTLESELSTVYTRGVMMAVDLIRILAQDPKQKEAAMMLLTDLVLNG